MNLNDRKAKLQHINRDLVLIQNALNECHQALEVIADRFKEERKENFTEQRKQSKRGGTTSLVLKVRLRILRAVNVPVAEWREITARGRSVDNAKAKMGSTLGKGATPRKSKGQMSVFTNAIPKNRINGWRIEDLMRHTHPGEYELIKTVEAELEPLRKRVKGLALNGKKLACARRIHERMLEAGVDDDRPQPAFKGPKRKVSSKLDAIQLDQRTTKTSNTVDPPQYRKVLDL